MIDIILGLVALFVTLILLIIIFGFCVTAFVLVLEIIVNKHLDIKIALSVLYILLVGAIGFMLGVVVAIAPFEIVWK